MSEVPQGDSGSSTVRIILMVVAVVFMIGSIIFMVQAQSRIAELEQHQIAAQKDTAQKFDDHDSKTRASINVLADKVGMTHKELTRKASDIQEAEKPLRRACAPMKNPPSSSSGRFQAKSTV